MCIIQGISQGSFYSPFRYLVSIQIFSFLHNLLKKLPLHHLISFVPSSKIKWTYIRGSIISGLYGVPLICLSLCQSGTVWITGSLKLWKQVVQRPPHFFSVLIVVLVTLGHLHFHMSCHISLWVSTKVPAEMFDWDGIEYTDQFEENEHHSNIECFHARHGICLHLLAFFNYFLQHLKFSRYRSF